MNKSFLAIVIAATLLISMVGIASANPAQQWDLDSDGIMYKLDHSESGSVTININDCYIWRAQQSASPSEGVYFKPETWEGRLYTYVSLSDQYTVDVGYCDADWSNFVSNGITGEEYTYSNTYGYSKYSIEANGFTVPQGKYLAFKVCNTGKDPSFTVSTTGGSYLDWAWDEPDYPVPELPTIILTSTGLLALVGYVRYRRRTNK